jgi:hypothetical protein
MKNFKTYEEFLNKFGPMAGSGNRDYNTEGIDESIVTPDQNVTEANQPTDATIRPHMGQYSVSDDPYEVAEELGKKYSWSQKQIEKAEKIIRKNYIKESVVTEAKSAGLSKEETLEVAQKFADAIAEVDGVKVTVNLKTLEKDSFDLDYDGTEFDGGSYNINADGSVVNMAVRTQPTVGTKDDDVKTIVKFMKKHYGKLAKNESSVTEAVKEVVLSNEILDFLEERGILKGSDAQKVHKDLTAFLKEKGINESVNEAAKIETERYVRSHGKKPNGHGWWMFSYNRDGSDMWEIPNGMSWPDAQKWAKKKAKEDGEDYVYVMESESSVTEATMQEIDKKVQKFVIKNANDYEYSNQDSAFQIYLSLKKLYPSLIKESVVTEGAMSELDIIAKEAKDFKSFVKEFKKEFKNMDAGSPKELEAWLQTIYDSAKETMD